MPNTPLYGFYDLEHLFDERIDDVAGGEAIVEDAIQHSLAEHNRQLNALMGLFVERTTEYKINFRSTTVTRSQPLDQDGRARPIQPFGKYEVAFPLQGSGNAWGANRIARVKMTVGEANRTLTSLIEGDIRWLRDHILAALFCSTSWTFNDDEWGGHGQLTIKGPANGDTDEYQVLTGADQAATDDHFKAQAAAIDDNNDPFEADRDELMEHPENQGEVICLVPTSLKASVRALSDYYPVADPNIEPGTGVTRLVGSLDVPLPGEVFGYHDGGVWLAEWQAMPPGYLVYVTTEGDPPLAMREFPEPELQGFHKAAETADYPFWEAQYARFAGFGAWNRARVVVRRVGNAAYAVPTGYSSPMP